MVDAGQRFHFLLEFLAHPGIDMGLLQQHFHHHPLGQKLAVPRQVHPAHSPAAEFPLHLIAVLQDERGGAHRGRGLSRCSHYGTPQNRGGLFVGSQQGLHFPLELWVAPAALAQELPARRRIAFHRAIEDRFYLLPALRCHAGFAAASSRCSQALADLHSRFIVAAEIPMTSAASSTSKPAKKRSSTSRLCRGSIRASRSRASSIAITSSSVSRPTRSSAS